MDYDFYSDQFQQSANALDEKMLAEKQLIASTGIIMDSVYLKLYKKEWANDFNDPLHAASRIFFSVWINDRAIKEKKIFYNIHAFKLRKLKSYPVAARAFAESFRKRFKGFEQHWENVSVRFGPLTLMEGWKEFDPENLKGDITGLAAGFLEIDHLIDEALEEFKPAAAKLNTLKK